MRIKFSMAIGGIALLLANAGPVTAQPAGPKTSGLRSGEYACLKDNKFRVGTMASCEPS